MVATHEGYLQGWNANWMEESIRQTADRSVEAVWTRCFNRDLQGYLAQSEGFRQYFCGDFLRSNLRTFVFDCRDFREWVDRRIETSWRELHNRNTGIGTALGAVSIPPVPAKTPLNCAALFLELYFFRLIPSLKVQIVAAIRDYLRSPEGAASIPSPGDQQRLLNLSSADGHDHSFDLVPINPLGTRTIRTLKSEDIGQLLQLSGVVTRCSEVKPEIRLGVFECQICRTKHTGVEQQFRFTEPSYCSHRGCNNRSKWTILLASSLFSDWQKLRVQQASHDDLPAGSVPRSIDVIARSRAVEQCKPGDCILACGCLLAAPDVPALMRPRDVVRDVKADMPRQTEGAMTDTAIQGLSKLGVRELGHKCIFVAVDIRVCATGGGDVVRPVNTLGGASSDELALTATSAGGRLLRELMSLDPDSRAVGSGSGSNSTVAGPVNAALRLTELLQHPLLASLGLSAEQRKRFRLVARSISCLDKLALWMAPEIYGSTAVKKGLMLMLVKGIEKRTRKDQIQLRGDINVCLVGDPGTAKSQFLKFVQGFADRAIFTSGKSSTAAGLTASVHKDPDQGEAVVEAGALILADRGVCCIDEFDKMAEKDMVAIHEAMEQQTISISKAGIQATMNARASVLAACNPIDGRYDRSRRLIENLRLSATVLSRFDLIFILLDQADEEEDRRVASHVLDGLDGGEEEAHADENEAMREEGGTGAPRTAQRHLRGALLKSTDELKQYIRIAQVFRPRLTAEAKRVLVKAYVVYRQQDCSERRSMRITVRQLESLIRLSEAVAKLHFSDVVTQHHADLATRLFGGCLQRVKADPVSLIESDAEEDDFMDGTSQTVNSPEGLHRLRSRRVQERRGAILIEADEYDLVQSQILEHIRRLNEKVLVQADPIFATQTLQQKERKAVIDWYLGEFHSDVVDSDEVESETRKVSLVVGRMLATGILYEERFTPLEQPAGQSTAENAGGQDSTTGDSLVVLQIHPNVDTSATRGASLLDLWSRRHRRAALAAAAAAAMPPVGSIQPPAVTGTPSVTTSTSVAAASQALAATGDAGLTLTDGDFLSMIYPR